MTDFVSPVGRFVQGSISLETKTDQQTKRPKTDENGNPIKECFIALAVRKDDPGLPAFLQLIAAQARAEFPHLFNEQGQCTHPQFAWKIQDGDGVDSTGVSVAGKAGFAGHMIFKLGTRYLPKCFHVGKYDPMQQIQNPTDVIKRGYYIRVSGTIRGNGVTPQDRTNKPGLYLSPNLVELVGFGPEIQTGPDAAKVFGALPAPALPPGASATPVAGMAPAGMPGAMPMPTPGAAPAYQAPAAMPMTAPGMAAMPAALPTAAAMPGMPGAAPAALPMPGAMPMPQMPAMPTVQAGPVYQMTDKAMGATREQLIGNNWTDEALLAHGLMIRVA